MTKGMFRKICKGFDEVLGASGTGLAIEERNYEVILAGTRFRVDVSSPILTLDEDNMTTNVTLYEDAIEVSVNDWDSGEKMELYTDVQDRVAVLKLRTVDSQFRPLLISGNAFSVNTGFDWLLDDNGTLVSELVRKAMEEGLKGAYSFFDNDILPRVRDVLFKARDFRPAKFSLNGFVTQQVSDYFPVVRSFIRKFGGEDWYIGLASNSFGIYTDNLDAEFTQRGSHITVEASPNDFPILDEYEKLAMSLPVNENVKGVFMRVKKLCKIIEGSYGKMDVVVNSLPKFSKIYAEFLGNRRTFIVEYKKTQKNEEVIISDGEYPGENSITILDGELQENNLKRKITRKEVEMIRVIEEVFSLMSGVPNVIMSKLPDEILLRT